VKIRAAGDTRRTPILVTIARSDARRSRGWQASIDPSTPIWKRGADVGFVEAPHNIDELRIVAREVCGPRPGPTCFEGCRRRWVPASELEALGPPSAI